MENNFIIKTLQVNKKLTLSLFRLIVMQTKPKLSQQTIRIFSVLCLVGLEDSVNFRDKSQGKVEENKAILDYFWNSIENCSMAIVSKYMAIKWLVL